MKKTMDKTVLYRALSEPGLLSEEEITSLAQCVQRHEHKANKPVLSEHERTQRFEWIVVASVIVAIVLGASATAVSYFLAGKDEPDTDEIQQKTCRVYEEIESVEEQLREICPTEQIR